VCVRARMQVLERGRKRHDGRNEHVQNFIGKNLLKITSFVNSD